MAPEPAQVLIPARFSGAPLTVLRAAREARSAIKRWATIRGDVGAMVLKATVRNGRIVVDEPTTLPEGAEVELRVVNDDGLSDARRRELHDSIAEGIRDGRSGRVSDFDAVMDELEAEP